MIDAPLIPPKRPILILFRNVAKNHLLPEASLPLFFLSADFHGFGGKRQVKLDTISGSWREIRFKLRVFRLQRMFGDYL